MSRLLTAFGLAILGLLLLPAGMWAQDSVGGELSIQTDGEADVGEVVDGQSVWLRLDLPAAVTEAVSIVFVLDRDTTTLGVCRVPAGERHCTTPVMAARGWFWDEEGEPAPQRTVYALSGVQVMARAAISVSPRPVVMVHGFGANTHTWDAYLGPSGFLAPLGVPAYAVGDGQVEGMLNTGNPLRPGRPTNSIAQNAAVLQEYIANVKEETGAGEVDLLVHSMGGLIARYYIDRLMEARDVTQLIMLGTPNAGSDCAVLPGSLHLYVPAAYELRSQYVQQVFNPQITERRGVPFYMFAGVPITRRILSACTEQPHDLVVSLASASAISTTLTEVSPLHVQLNTDEALFHEHVEPLLRRSVNAFDDEQELTPPPAQAAPPLQFTRVFTGHIQPGQPITHTIRIEAGVIVASFGLYDPSTSLTVTVRGASGAVIELTPDEHGLIQVDDPELLFHLGYGFENPRPGAWQVTLQTGRRTPPQGVTYALTAQMVGGAELQTALSNHLPGLDDSVVMSATLRLEGARLQTDSVQAHITHSDGESEVVALQAEGGIFRAEWQPPRPGIYSIDLVAQGVAPDGTPIERTAVLALEAFRRSPLQTP